MSSASRVLFEKTVATTQCVEAVVEMLKFLGREYDPLPDAVKLTGLVLVLSNKKDCFYVVGPHDCSCPAKTYNPGKSCKHQRRFYPEQVKHGSMADALAQIDSIRPAAKWEGGYGGPVSDLMGKTKGQCKASR